MIEIRTATVDDVAGIAIIHAKSWQEIYRGFMPQEFLDSITSEQRLPMWKRETNKLGFDYEGKLAQYESITNFLQWKTLHDPEFILGRNRHRRQPISCNFPAHKTGDTFKKFSPDRFQIPSIHGI